jgi:hypothetical protein
MLKTFHDRSYAEHHDGFQNWRGNNPAGIFLTIETKTKANLHGSQCFHLGSTDWDSGNLSGHSLTKNKKVLGGSYGELKAWASNGGFEIHVCSHCVRDGYIDKALFEQATMLPKSAANSAYGASSVDSFSVEAIEGLTHEVTVLSRQRSGALRASAIAKSQGHCEACGVDFSKLLSGLGVRVLQVHHRNQLSLEVVPVLTNVNDLAVVCANCHSLIHSDSKLTMPVEVLQRLLASEGSTA